MGRVQDLSFSTRHPDELLCILREAASIDQATPSPTNPIPFHSTLK
jgi:hypothetical protein